MGFLRRVFMQQEAAVAPTVQLKEGRTPPIALPNLPTPVDLERLELPKPTGFVERYATPVAVTVGAACTVLALLGMLKSSYAGNKVHLQKYMRYRVMAQFFTVSALVAGATYFAVQERRKADLAVQQKSQR